MVDSNPFLRFALADELAKQVVVQIADLDRDYLLLWKSYLKRMKPVPDAVLLDAVQAYRYASESVGLRIQDGNDGALVMDKAGDLLWNELDDDARHEWLLKAD